MEAAETLDLQLQLQKEKDQRLIRAAYRRLLRAISHSEIAIEDKNQIRDAFEFALKAHGNQRRKSGEPYITHPLEVARICYEEMGLGPTAVIAALLHDTVEDTPVELGDVEQQFGPKITKIVDGLTKLDGLYNVESPQAENFKKVLSTLVEDVRVVLIKMADRLHNLRTIDIMPRHKQLKIAAETSYIYAPLAHRLGLYNLKSEFMDLCLKITEPELYHEINNKLKQTQKDRNKFINDFIKPLKVELDKLNLKYKIFGRPKTISSISNKIKTKKVAFEEIYDLFAVRIVLDVPLEKEKSACWLFYSIVTDVHRPIPERLKDWITTPKSNGYESLHTTVIGPGGRYVEVQIRSKRMDEIAEKGFAAHWKYKEVNSLQSVYDHWFDSVRDVLETPHNDAIEFLNDFKANLYGEEVYIYTPNGDMKVLPKGATVLDFAFSIHTDIGYHASAFKVNNKLVPMGQALESGDQVQILTNKNQKPTEDWIQLVVTGKARSRIRTALKEEKRKAADMGKEILERKFKNGKLLLDENLDLLAKTFNFKTRFDLYCAIGEERLDVTESLKTFNIDKGRLIEIKPEPVEDKEPVAKSGPAAAKQNVGILVNGENARQYHYTLAHCCNPLHGDEIFAYVTTNSGLRIHRSNCPNAEHLMVNHGYRILKAEWSDKLEETFNAELLIIGIDDGPGVIERLSHHISTKLGVNITSFSIKGHQGTFEGKIGLTVNNRTHLNYIITALSQLEGISSVHRVDH
ncbi:MAG: bifunctional (p)ppGpp synthetase/guanosine-3',5'-bis(diphosphate) 3'-pyrophosphohydrolase [Saprospiraceae bacterium]|nr:bifunctional (p)ppGpp synthetase/guanosine-3',5'-bis(diphosphate) 3'-pyrophosphohydrolase [Saprospiraceae bacterium]MBK7736607.1 bifunctional (p)ppGpp synthetase/guanosine-3',5'-bis(diphosphate) 3'-pyrophosphohydrolase [Saprospiraceae bacterium]MBK7912029.1 bifunctional (p)ppGpp synthetase/guanosine-3',5'-bis(diphosphate) 3'-pyrophosphohydrolase [Saprospiraceae bacterium]